MSEASYEVQAGCSFRRMSSASSAFMAPANPASHAQAANSRILAVTREIGEDSSADALSSLESTACSKCTTQGKQSAGTK